MYVVTVHDRKTTEATHEPTATKTKKKQRRTPEPLTHSFPWLPCQGRGGLERVQRHQQDHHPAPDPLRVPRRLPVPVQLPPARGAPGAVPPPRAILPQGPISLVGFCGYGGVRVGSIFCCHRDAWPRGWNGIWSSDAWCMKCGGYRGEIVEFVELVSVFPCTSRAGGGWVGVSLSVAFGIWMKNEGQTLFRRINTCDDDLTSSRFLCPSPSL